MFGKLTRTQAAKMADAVNNWHNYDNSGYNKIHHYRNRHHEHETDF